MRNIKNVELFEDKYGWYLSLDIQVDMLGRQVECHIPKVRLPFNQMVSINYTKDTTDIVGYDRELKELAVIDKKTINEKYTLECGDVKLDVEKNEMDDYLYITNIEGWSK